MAVTKPVIFTPTEDAEIDYKKPVSEELIRKMVQNVNLLGSLAPIGSYRHVNINQPGATPPNGKIYQQCDGSEIVDPDSPLRSIVPISRFTHNMQNRYVRGAPGETSGDNADGGSATVNLSHTHSTGNACTGIDVEEGDERHSWFAVCHNHAISADLDGSEPLDVAHQQLAIYVKIN